MHYRMAVIIPKADRRIAESKSSSKKVSSARRRGRLVEAYHPPGTEVQLRVRTSLSVKVIRMASQRSAARSAILP